MVLTFVNVDGERTSAGCAAALVRLSQAFSSAFGMQLRLTSGYRTTAEQTTLFVARYQRQDSGNGPYDDVRTWNGQRWVRHSPDGTVAQPGTSRHEKSSAVDLRDTGSDSGVTVAGTTRSNWMRANASAYGFQPTGFGFGEPWHFDYTGSHAGPAPAMPKPEPAKPSPAPAPEPAPDPEKKPRPVLNSLVRTYVPWLVGVFVGWIVSTGIEVDQNWRAIITVAVTVIISMIYYAVVRFLETKVAPKFGWLLGLAKHPDYPKK